MDIHILGGFLGTGKTTLLMKLVSMFSEKGKKVSIIVNEAGSIGVDGTTIKGQGYNAVELPQGCICCTLVGALQESLVNVVNDYHPDVLIIEPTGLALPNAVKESIEVIKGKFIEYDKIDIVAMLDGPRYDIFITKKKDFYIKQLSGSDIIAVNKKDLVSEEKLNSIMEWVKETFPGVKVVPMCAVTGEGVDEVFQVI
ncbi:MAG: GTPase [Candidatus Methanomethylophilaceae archaeon]|nr:GTPase [Candidatus Methanomethylophilaceae archaeon]